jgi:hypothetical protein
MNKLVGRSSSRDEQATGLNLDRETAATKARYDRIAPLYDVMEWATERLAFQAWREEPFEDTSLEKSQPYGALCPQAMYRKPSSNSS